jgi:hypothetical protein
LKTYRVKGLGSKYQYGFKGVSMPEPLQSIAGLPTLVEALEFRREQYELNQTQWSAVLGLGLSHYNEFVHGKRPLPKQAMAKAYAYGVPAECLFQCLPVLGAADIDRRLAELELQRRTK